MILLRIRIICSTLRKGSFVPTVRKGSFVPTLRKGPFVPTVRKDSFVGGGSCNNPAVHVKPNKMSYFAPFLCANPVYIPLSCELVKLCGGRYRLK